MQKLQMVCDERRRLDCVDCRRPIRKEQNLSTEVALGCKKLNFHTVVTVKYNLKSKYISKYICK